MPDLNTIAVGLVSGIQDESTAMKTTVAVFLSVALYNALELIVLILFTFHHYRGLYFWSLLICDVFGIIPTTIGAVLHFFAIGPLWLALILSVVGFYAMVPVQSLVLYSRLHLILHNDKVLRYLLLLIFIVAGLFLPPTTVTIFGSAYTQSPHWNRAYQVTERLQLTAFCFQESLISAMYIRESAKLLRLWPSGRGRRKLVMYELLSINFIIILLDSSLLVLEYWNLYYLQVSFKSLVYSVKLKLEFAVLGKLVSIATCHHDDIHSNFSC